VMCWLGLTATLSICGPKQSTVIIYEVAHYLNAASHYYRKIPNIFVEWCDTPLADSNLDLEAGYDESFRGFPKPLHSNNGLIS
jgi:hypothetical protein